MIPLSLLMVEAYGQYRVIRDGGIDLPYKAAFWNLFAAGVLGFLSYFEHGSFLTAAHGHGALMGVCGMLAIALTLYSLRDMMPDRYWKEKWIMVSFWALNAGLMRMITLTLVPIGVMQALESFRSGFWSARAWEFYQQPAVSRLVWLRGILDGVFIALGVLPLVAAVTWGALHMRKAELPPAVPGHDNAEEPYSRDVPERTWIHS